MDWSAVALLLAERASLPVLLLGAAGEIQLIAPAAQLALGWHEDCVGKSWEQFVAPKALPMGRYLIDKALSGATHHLSIEMMTAQGAASVTLESYPIGHEDGRGVLLFVERVFPSGEQPPRKDFDYEVEGLASGQFKLRFLQTLGQEPSHPQGSCYEVLHGRASLCEQCPVRTLEQVGECRTEVRPCEGEELEIKTARLVEVDRAGVSVRRVSQASFPAMLHARLHDLSERALLSERERDVLRLLIDGRSFEEIGEALDITARTVKFHQAKLLAKLGADSRNDLIRLIF